MVTLVTLHFGSLVIRYFCRISMSSQYKSFWGTSRFGRRFHIGRWSQAQSSSALCDCGSPSWVFCRRLPLVRCAPGGGARLGAPCRTYHQTTNSQGSTETNTKQIDYLNKYIFTALNWTLSKFKMRYISGEGITKLPILCGWYLSQTTEFPFDLT